MTGILWGLCGAILIGGSDCIARVTSQRVSMSVLFLMIMGISLIVLSLWLGFKADWPPWNARAWIASAGSGILNLLALYFLYRALARGPVAVASPAASTFTVLLVGLNVMFGATWSWSQILAMIVVFAGVALLARPSSTDADNQHYDAAWLRTTAFFGLAAAATVAVRMFLAQEAGVEIGAIHALYLNRLFALFGALVLVGYCLLRQQAFPLPERFFKAPGHSAGCTRNWRSGCISHRVCQWRQSGSYYRIFSVCSSDYVVRMGLAWRANRLAARRIYAYHQLWRFTCHRREPGNWCVKSKVREFETAGS